ncbi:MAG: phenylacetate--CoA ligase family protein [Anaerolineae bacterium]|nr:phenylacetate--CoA ligase family protein [Anaerolineae bacterium]
MNIETVIRLLGTARQLRRHEHWTRDQLETYQNEALTKLRASAYAHSPFYREFHRGMYHAPLNELPVLTKRTMMDNFDELVTDRSIHLADIREHRNTAPDSRYLGHYWVNATSGSTGSPGIFLYDGREWAIVLASFARSYEWAGLRLNLAHRRKIAVISSTTPWHMSYVVGTTLQSPWVSTLRLAATEPLERIVDQLNEWQPEVLVAYASMARVLAVEQMERRLEVSPKVVFTSSEVLTDEARRLIEAVWGKRLFNQYAATETAGIAAECEHHVALHLFEDLILVENVDEHNRPVPPGVYGDKVLITTLFNYTQPLIRYELGDSIRLAEGICACGRPFALVDGIQGRVEDTLTFLAADGQTKAIHPNVFHQVMDTVPLREWQIIQRDDGLHVLASGLEPGEPTSALHDAISSALTEQLNAAPAIRIHPVDAIPRTANGKAPLIRSELHAQAAD